MPLCIRRHQIAITPIVTGTAKHQDGLRGRPVAQQLAKRRPGGGLHQLETINALLINQIPVYRSHRVGGVKRFW
jgi:hypothetical protein